MRLVVGPPGRVAGKRDAAYGVVLILPRELVFVEARHRRDSRPDLDAPVERPF